MVIWLRKKAEMEEQKKRSQFKVGTLGTGTIAL
jgi:hypothetical protein